MAQAEHIPQILKKWELSSGHLTAKFNTSAYSIESDFI